MKAWILILLSTTLVTLPVQAQKAKEGRDPQSQAKALARSKSAEALKAWSTGNRRKAAQLAEEGRKLDPSFYQPYYVLSLCAEAEGRQEKAAQLSLAAFNRNRADGSLALLAARRFRLAGKSSIAHQLLDMAQKATASPRDVGEERASLFFLEKRWKKAVKVLVQLKHASPKDLEIRRRLVTALIASNQRELLAKELDELDAMNPRNPAWAIQRMTIELNAKRYEEALRHLESLCERFQENLDVRRLAVDVLERTQLAPQRLKFHRIRLQQLEKRRN